MDSKADESTEASNTQESEDKPKVIDIKYFDCSLCGLHEQFSYFGIDPPFFRKYRLTENTYVIEDPFMPPKQGEILMLGSHCIKCNKTVCKDQNCSFYYDGTYCIHCAKADIKLFPETVKDKLNKIILT